MVLLLLGLITWGLLSERRAVQQMDPKTRAMLFNQTWQSFQLVCHEGADPGLASRCRDQARFLSEFPECQDDCRRRIDFFHQPRH